MVSCDKMILAHPADQVSASSVLFSFLSLFRVDPSAVLVLVGPAGDAPPPPEDELDRFVEAALADARVVRATLEDGTDVTVASSGALLRVFREAQPDMLEELIGYVSGTPFEVDHIERYASLRFERDVLRRAPEHVLHLSPANLRLAGGDAQRERGREPESVGAGVQLTPPVVIAEHELHIA